MKKFLKIGLVLLLLFSMVACQKTEKKEPKDYTEEFAQYTKDFVAYYYGETDYGINFDFEHPEDYGIVKGLYAFEGFTKKDYEDYMGFLKEEIDYLKGIDSAGLNDADQWTYAVILDYLEREYAVKDYFYFEAKGFGSINGINSNLPLLLDEFIFNDKQDVDSYINLLITTPVIIESYLQLELERRDNGYGLSQIVIDSIIAQCNTILETKNYFLEDSFNKKIDAVDFLTAEEKQTYKQLNKEHLYGEYYGGYRLLLEELSKIDGTFYNEMPLALVEGGLKYYELLIKRQLGIEKTPKELIDYLEKEIDEIIGEYMALYYANGDSLFDEYPYFTSGDSFEEIIDYLYEAIQEDFPPLEKSSIEIKTVDASMAENFSPAAYLITKYDSPVSSREVILINGVYEDANFTTYAHEGYPGHLYQNVYYKSLDLNMANYILSNIGYTEGWAVYTELYALKYSDLPETIKRFTYLNSRLNNAVFCLFELKIHYEGMNKDEFNEYANLYFAVDQEWSDMIYDLVVEMPSYFLYYNLSYLLIEDAKEQMATAYGASFTDYQFHEFVLNHGNGSIGLLLKELEKELKKK